MTHMLKQMNMAKDVCLDIRTRIKALTKRAAQGINVLGALVAARARLAAARQCVKAFAFLYKRPWTGIQDVVHLEVRRQSIANMRYWLVKNRIRHCSLCLGIDRPMHATQENGFVCDRHEEKLVKP